MIKVAIVGFGYWGPNLLRNFLLSENCSVAAVCDTNREMLRILKKNHPDMHATTNYDEILKDTAIRAVIIATPPGTHFTLVHKALLAKKDVLVEKPMTTTIADAEKLVALAETQKRILMVDHTFVYSKPIEKIGEIIKRGDLGNVVNIDSVRINLGLYQQDVNVIQDLAVHDFTILDYLIGKLPKSIMVIGANHFDTKQEDQSYIHLWYPGKIFANINVSWLSPIKVRRMIFCGTKRMLVYDDIEQSEKIKIFETGIKVERDPKQIFQMRVGYHKGDIYSPSIEIKEPLSTVAQDFLNSIRTRKSPRCDSYAGLRVVKVLELAMKSLRDGGRTVEIS